MSASPELSVAIVLGPLRRRAQRVVDAVAAQDVADRIELVLVDLEPRAEALVVPPHLREVHVPLPGGGLSAAKATAVRRATAPVVAFVEDHCYPEPGWAAALLEAHRGPCAAVGYTFVNANPETRISRSAMFADYGMFAHPHPGGPAELISGNNVSYKRDRVLPFGDRLGDLLVVDFNIQEALKARGESLYIAADAVAAHENYVKTRDLAEANRSYCRLMAANRSRGWSRRRRWLYALATPLGAPAVKLIRFVRNVAGRPSLAPEAVASLPVLLSAYAWAAVGEARGYLDASPRVAEETFKIWELDTVRVTA